MSDDDETKREEINQFLDKQKSINERTSEFAKMLSQNGRALNVLQRDLAEHCKKQGIERFETPSKIVFVKEIWTPDTGLVTDSLKLKRKAIETFYSEKIMSVYV